MQARFRTTLYHGAQGFTTLYHGARGRATRRSASTTECSRTASLITRSNTCSGLYIFPISVYESDMTDNNTLQIRTRGVAVCRTATCILPAGMRIHWQVCCPCPDTRTFWGTRRQKGDVNFVRWSAIRGPPPPRSTRALVHTYRYDRCSTVT